MELKPNEDLYGNQEGFKNYYSRIKLKHWYKKFPKEVFEQWIHPHHNNIFTLRNYSWINFEEIEFSLVEWNNEEIEKIRVTDRFQDYVESRSNYSDISEFYCREQDLKHWKDIGTWRMPPIILDVSTLEKDFPDFSDLKETYQLVEGHSRLGYFKSMQNVQQFGKGNLAEKHKVYLMKKLYF